MSTLAVTFGNGSFQPLAETFARRFSALNGIDAMAIDPMDAPPLEDPSWIKAWLWDLVPKSVDRVVWFDADCVPVAPVMDLFPSHDYPFGAVSDMDSSITEALRHCADAKSCQYYLNAGLFFARRVTRPLFDEWKSFLGKDAGFRDQTAMNIVLNRYYKASDICLLSPLVNWLGGFGKAPQNVRMLHLAGWENDKRRFQILRAFARVFEPVVKGICPREELLCVDG